MAARSSRFEGIRLLDFQKSPLSGTGTENEPDTKVRNHPIVESPIFLKKMGLYKTCFLGIFGPKGSEGGRWKSDRFDDFSAGICYFYRFPHRAIFHEQLKVIDSPKENLGPRLQPIPAMRGSMCPSLRSIGYAVQPWLVLKTCIILQYCYFHWPIVPPIDEFRDGPIWLSALVFKIQVIDA